MEAKFVPSELLGHSYVLCAPYTYQEIFANILGAIQSKVNQVVWVGAKETVYLNFLDQTCFHKQWSSEQMNHLIQALKHTQQHICVVFDQLPWDMVLGEQCIEWVNMFKQCMNIVEKRNHMICFITEGKHISLLYNKGVLQANRTGFCFSDDHEETTMEWISAYLQIQWSHFSHSLSSLNSKNEFVCRLPWLKEHGLSVITMEEHIEIHLMQPFVFDVQTLKNTPQGGGKPSCHSSLTRTSNKEETRKGPSSQITSIDRDNIYKHLQTIQSSIQMIYQLLGHHNSS